MKPSDYVRQVLNGQNEVQHSSHGDAGMVTSSDQTDDGIQIRMAGRPQQNEDGVHQLCVRLALAVSLRDGGDWRADDHPPHGPETGTDWSLRTAQGGEWGVQVTRVGKTQRWETLANGRHVLELLSTSEAAAEIWDAIERKLRTKGGILALSVGQPGAHAFAGVIDEFRRAYGALVRASVRYSQVWLVGYTLETTVRLHPE